MRINTSFYCLKQGLRNVFRNKWFSLATIATISACLFLFGLLYSILMNVQHMVKSSQDIMCVTAFLEENTSDERVQEIYNMLERREDVREFRYLSADQAWEEYKVELGEYASDIKENPLYDCAHFEVYVEDVAHQPALVSFLENLANVRKVNSAALTAQALTGLNSIIGYVSVGIIAILFAVSIFLISNTVTIGISVRKEEIQIMKYIGATDFFVRAPFVIEGILIGLIGSLIPLAGVYVIYNEAMLFVAESFSYLSQIMQFLDVREIFSNLVPVCIGLGVGIGFLGSFTTVRKHLSV